MVARHGLAAVAGVATEAALTYPLDTLKTLLQVSLISTFPIQMHMEFDFDFFSPFFFCICLRYVLCSDLPPSEFTWMAED